LRQKNGLLTPMEPKWTRMEAKNGLCENAAFLLSRLRPNPKRHGLSFPVRSESFELYLSLLRISGPSFRTASAADVNILLFHHTGLPRHVRRRWSAASSCGACGRTAAPRTFDDCEAARNLPRFPKPRGVRRYDRVSQRPLLLLRSAEVVSVGHKFMCQACDAVPVANSI
jgi:hypothetical protein